jgi:hypothetical protein
MLHKTSRKSKQEPVPDPALARVLHEFLTAQSDQLEPMWQALEQMAPPPVRRRIIEGFVQTLVHANAAMRQQSSQVLRVIGPPALPFLEASLHNSRKTSFSIALIETLAAIGATLEVGYQTRLLFTLMIKTNTSANEAMRAACAHAIAKLRQAQPNAAKSPVTPCNQP